jgi:G:T-mismatch repair DNA endonuclease (very short patch repair protein)
MDVSGIDMKAANILVVPKTRIDWWVNKINSNIANDVKAIKL